MGAASRRLPSRSPSDDIFAALVNRPEIRQSLYELRISEQEVRAAILGVLPGAILTQSWHSDSTSFLLHGDWVNQSSRVTANLINLVRLPETLRSIESQQDLNRQRTIETASAVSLQVYASRARLMAQFSTYRDADELYRNHRALRKQVQDSIRAGRMPEQAATREELATLLAEVRAILAFGDLDAAYGAYEAAIGQIPLQFTGSINQ
jgi:hypothetical protein